tara:strand:+ start:56 stop:313 length:258 start_codon:yes stop_codon:yes gene_type:complete
MLKEIKYFIYISFTFLFIFFVVKYYLSEKYEKKYFRKMINFEKNLKLDLSKLPVLLNNTNNIIEYKNLTNDSTKIKNRSFWNLIK